VTQTQTSQADQAKINAAIAALAAAQLAQLWPLVDWASPDAASAVKTAYAAVVTQFGQAAASRAAEFYDDTRAEQNIRQAFRAVPADPVPQARIDKAVDSAFLGNPDAPADTTSALPVEQRVPQRLDDSLQRLVLQPGRDTIAGNTKTDPVHPRWVRVPTGATTCAFCIMLASRDVAEVRGKTIDMKYTSSKSAGIDGTGIFNTYHKHCDCVAVPIFPGQNIEDISPKIGDYQDMYYKAAADAGTHRDPKKILASMRKLHGLK
jgi:hypothetical protein